jgi:hypothetical protein
MLNEYAIDPGCLSDWGTFRYLLDQIGVPNGRIVSQFPKDWFKNVYEAIEGFQEKKQAETILKRIKDRASISSGRAYSHSIWFNSALEQHEKQPFHAIITKKPSVRAEYILVADEISGETTRWAVTREKKIPRTIEALGESIEPLLRMSEQILFVDKFFHPAKDKWKKSLQHFVELSMRNRKKPPIFEYHCKADDVEAPVFQKQCVDNLSVMLPRGVKLKLVRWNNNYQGDMFHARYVLTEKGGVRVDWGLDRGSKGEKTDVTLLDDTMWKETWSMFQSQYFQFVDSFEVYGTK